MRSRSKGSRPRSSAASAIAKPAPTCCSSKRRSGASEVERVAGHFKGVPLLYNMAASGKTPDLPADELARLGFKLAIYPNWIILAAIPAMQAMLRELKEKGSVADIRRRSPPSRSSPISRDCRKSRSSKNATGCRRISAPVCEPVEHLYTSIARRRQDVESIAARIWHTHCSNRGPPVSEVLQWQPPRVMDCICLDLRSFWPPRCFRALRRFCCPVDFYYTRSLKDSAQPCRSRCRFPASPARARLSERKALVDDRLDRAAREQVQQRLGTRPAGLRVVIERMHRK